MSPLHIFDNLRPRYCNPTLPLVIGTKSQRYPRPSANTSPALGRTSHSANSSRGGSHRRSHGKSAIRSSQQEISFLVVTIGVRSGHPLGRPVVWRRVQHSGFLAQKIGHVSAVSSASLCSRALVYSRAFLHVKHPRSSCSSFLTSAVTLIIVILNSRSNFADGDSDSDSLVRSRLHAFECTARWNERGATDCIHI